MKQPTVARSINSFATPQNTCYVTREESVLYHSSLLLSIGSERTIKNHLIERITEE